MRTLLFVNNWVGSQVVAWLRERGETLVGLVMHPEGRQRYGREILAAAALPSERVFDGSRLDTPETLAALRALEPDIGVSAYFGYILRRPILSLPAAGCVNLHPAYLPYQRGANPNVWSLLEEGTPAGATLHYMDEGVDTGDIIHQRQLVVAPTDTGATLYRRLELLALEVFQEGWPLLAAGTRRPQDPSAGCTHRMRDLAPLDEIHLDESYRARDLINLLRARTFPPYHGAYFRAGQKKVYIRIELSEEEDGA